MAEKTRWTVSRDEGARTPICASYLAEHGGKRGDLSKFIERAAAKEVLPATVRDIRKRNADIPADELQALIDEECAAVRQEFCAIGAVAWTETGSFSTPISC